MIGGLFMGGKMDTKTIIVSIPNKKRYTEIFDAVNAAERQAKEENKVLIKVKVFDHLALGPGGDDKSNNPVIV